LTMTDRQDMSQKISRKAGKVHWAFWMIDQT
jgi:hypothetical protein